MAIIKMTLRSEHDYPYAKRMLEKYFGLAEHKGIELGDTNIYKFNIAQFESDEEVFIHQMHYTPITNSAAIIVGNRRLSIEVS